MKKICVFTGTRAEYGLLKPLIKLIQNEEDFELQILVSGMHLSPEFGYTVDEIINDGFIINEKVEMLLSSDTSSAITKSMGVAMIGFADSLQRLSPDLVVILGDRFESLAFSTSCMIANIPIAHLNGGEATYGVIDEPIRHSISKMSHLHFTATEEFKDRVIQLGENPNSVFNTGSIGLDNVENTKYATKLELEKTLNFKFQKQNILVTFHPVSMGNNSTENQIEELLLALDSFPEIGIIFTKGNADTDGRIINSIIDDYTKKRENASSFKSLGSKNYLSCLKVVNGVVGNSSSGLIEVPSFKIGTVNIGNRQEGRTLAKSVICTTTDSTKIKESISTILSSTFIKSISEVENPYRKPNTAKSILKVLKNIDLNGITKKVFYDLNVNLKK